MKATRKSIAPQSVPEAKAGTSHGRYIGDLEWKLHQLGNLAHIAATWVEDAFATDMHKELGKQFVNFYHLDEERVSAMLFLVYELQAKARTLQEDYHAALEAGVITQAEAKPPPPATTTMN